MSVHVCSWAWRQKLSDSGAKIVLLKLADACNDDGVCWPSQKFLSDHCEMSERNVRFKIQKLESAGLLAIKRTKREDGTWNPNVYKLSSGSPLPMEPEENQRKPTSSETLIEPKGFRGSPLPLGSECPKCGIRVSGKTLAEHLEDVHGERAA